MSRTCTGESHTGNIGGRPASRSKLAFSRGAYLTGPSLHQDRFPPSLRIRDDEVLVLFVELLRGPEADLEIVRHPEPAFLEAHPRDIEPHDNLLLRLLAVRAECVAVRHRESPKPPERGHLATLLRPERGPGARP